jgi:hypothetical protein
VASELGEASTKSIAVSRLVLFDYGKIGGIVVKTFKTQSANIQINTAFHHPSSATLSTFSSVPADLVSQTVLDESLANQRQGESHEDNAAREP